MGARCYQASDSGTDFIMYISRSTLVPTLIFRNPLRYKFARLNEPVVQNYTSATVYDGTLLSQDSVIKLAEVPKP